MTYIPSETGMVGIADSARILLAVFPNYPDLQPCNSIPSLEPTWPTAGACADLRQMATSL
jgi:hypothetical protein